jgi:hypothetical protein
MNKITEEYLKELIDKKLFVRFFDKTVVCCIKLKNGFEVIGSSACVDPKNFKIEIGEKVAFENAVSKLWELEGYLLQSLKETFKKLESE